MLESKWYCNWGTKNINEVNLKCESSSINQEAKPVEKDSKSERQRESMP